MRRVLGSGALLLMLMSTQAGGSASGSRVVVTPKCIAAYACATVTAGWKPPYGADAGSGKAVSTPAGINCTYTFGIESGTCSYTFSWPIGQASGPYVSVTWESAYGSIFCFGSPTCTAPTTALWVVGNLSAGASDEFDISIF